MACIKPWTYVLTLCSDYANNKKNPNIIIFWHMWSPQEELNMSVTVKSSSFLMKSKILEVSFSTAHGKMFAQTIWVFKTNICHYLHMQSLAVLPCLRQIVHWILKGSVGFTKPSNHRRDLCLKPPMAEQVAQQSRGNNCCSWGRSDRSTITFIFSSPQVAKQHCCCQVNPGRGRRWFLNFHHFCEGMYP